VNRFERLLGILLALRGGRPCSAGELARRFEVSTRTIYRDVEVLSALGVPVYAERGRGGGLRLLPGYFLPPVAFTTGEAISLVLGLTLLRSLRARPFAGELDTAEQKLLAAMPDRLRATVRGADRILGVEGVPGDAFHVEPDVPAPVPTPVGQAAPLDEAAVVDTFLRAVLDGATVRLCYRSPYSNRVTEWSGTPLGALWDRDRWYLIATAPGDDRSLRLWRSDRVRAIAQGPPATASGRPAFDVRRLLGRAWLDEAMRQWSAEAPVRIRLSVSQAARLQRDWYYRHADFQPQPDGHVVLTFGEGNRERVLELVRWLGPDAELLEPPAWRDALREQLARMKAVYGRREGTSPPAPSPMGEGAAADRSR